MENLRALPLSFHAAVESSELSTQVPPAVMDSVGCFTTRNFLQIEGCEFKIHAEFRRTFYELAPALNQEDRSCRFRRGDPDRRRASSDTDAVQSPGSHHHVLQYHRRDRRGYDLFRSHLQEM